MIMPSLNRAAKSSIKDLWYLDAMDLETPKLGQHPPKMPSFETRATSFGYQTKPMQFLSEHAQCHKAPDLSHQSVHQRMISTFLS